MGRPCFLRLQKRCPESPGDAIGNADSAALPIHAFSPIPPFPGGFALARYKILSTSKEEKDGTNMSHPLSFLIDNALREAEANGAFENLPGAGKPIRDLHQPGNAVIDRMLKEAKAKPPVVVFKEKVAESRERLQALTDPTERKEEMRRLADLQTRLAIEQEAFRRYG